MSIRLLFIFCLLPCAAFAQSWNFCAGGGAMWNSKTSKGGSYEHGSPIGGTAALGLSYKTGNWEGGLSLGYRRYAFTIKGYLVMEDDFDPLTGTIIHAPREFSYVEPTPAFIVAPFAKYHFGKGRLNYYAGVMPGYVYFLGPEYTDKLTGHATRGDGGHGFALEALAGCGYRLFGPCSAFAEATGGATNMPYFTERTWVGTTSLSLGLQVRIAGKK